MERVVALLKAIRLEQYARKFEEEGWDDVDFLKTLDQQALQDLAQTVRMKPGHLDRFVRNVHRADSISQAWPRGHAAQSGASPSWRAAGRPRRRKHDGGMEAVVVALTALRLESYAPQFEEQGWDDLDDILSLEPKRLKEVALSLGMKHGHAGKLLSKLSGTCRDLEAGNHPPSSGDLTASSSRQAFAPSGRASSSQHAFQEKRGGIARTSPLESNSTTDPLLGGSPADSSDEDREAPRRSRAESVEHLRSKLAAGEQAAGAAGSDKASWCCCPCGARLRLGCLLCVALAAALAAVLAMGVLNNAAERVEFSMTVKGVNFLQLSSYPALCSEIESNIREVVATASVEGILPEHVAVVLSAGSLVVRSTIYPPSGVDIVAVQESLQSRASLPLDLADSLAGLAGIQSISDGPLTIADVSYVGHVVPNRWPIGSVEVFTNSTTATQTSLTESTLTQTTVWTETTSTATITRTNVTVTSSTSHTSTSLTTASRAPPETVSTPECGEAEVGVRYIAPEVYSIPEIGTAAECCLKCRSFPQDQGGCTAWTWEFLCDDCHHTCTLKGGKNFKSPIFKASKPGVVSGLAVHPAGEPRVPFLPVPDELPSLWCYALMLPGTYEEELLRMQHSQNLSLFACDAWKIYSNSSIALAKGVTTGVVDSNLSCELGGEFMTALNTDIFLQVWIKVLSDGYYLKYDWTVKVDPDTVWFPGRLVSRLVEWQEREGGTYLNNCKFGLHGPIEVFSRNALKVLAKDLRSGKESARCVTEQEWGLWGEDLFMDQCLLNVLKVQRINDWSLICEDHCECPEYVNCQRKDKVSFHPFKTKESYLQCVKDSKKPTERALELQLPG